MRYLLVVVFWLDLMWFNPYQNGICSETCEFKCWSLSAFFFSVRFPFISFAICYTTEFFYYAEFSRVHNKLCTHLLLPTKKKYHLSTNNRYLVDENSHVDGDAISDLPAEVFCLFMDRMVSIVLSVKNCNCR